MLLSFIVLAFKLIDKDSKNAFMITVYMMQNMGAIPVETMATLAACFVNAVFSGFLRIFQGKVSL